MDLDNGMEQTICEFVDETEVGGQIDTWEDRAAI